jgi:hypothetical protein
MSHTPAIVAQLARAVREAAESFGAFPGTHAMPISSPQHPAHVPLSQRPSHVLWARADELASMASTARTADARIALEALVARFAALAAKREFAETMAMDSETACGHR